MSFSYSSIKRVLRGNKSIIELPICERESPGWCSENLRNYTPVTREILKVEQLAKKTNMGGAQPLWEDYSRLQNYPYKVDKGAKRFPDEVRTDANTGSFFTWLVEHKKPSVVLEFGAAFGVSGMYWLVGMEANGFGQLLSFEPNTLWASIAEKNFSAISNRFLLTQDTFEKHALRLKQEDVKVDIAFIDAIHTSEFVHQQLNLVLQIAAPGALIILDDINFSEDMRRCWKEVSQDMRFVSVYHLGERLGILELSKAHPG